jgi:spore coat polysaccharide biosynthesis protein SpsF
MSKYSTSQEEFWAGEFGDAYIDRNRSAAMLAANVAMFARIVPRLGRLSSVLELGANVGLNLQAVRTLVPDVALTAVEINHQAAEQLRALGGITVHEQSLLEFEPRSTVDLTFTKGVLIHLNPDFLPKAYDVLYRASRRFVMVAEYYNPRPQEISYRGHAEKLFKRDFAGEMLERHSDLSLVDYGFVYHRDPFPQDDITWFLMEKRS